MRRHALRHLGGAPALLAARGRAQMRWVGIGRPCARVLGGRPRAAWGLASAPLFLVRPRSRTPPFPPSSRGGGPPVLPVPADPLASGTCPLVPPPRDMGDACTSTGVETRSRSRQQQQRGTKRPHSGGKGGLRSPAAFADSFFLAPRASQRQRDLRGGRGAAPALSGHLGRLPDEVGVGLLHPSGLAGVVGPQIAPRRLLLPLAPGSARPGGRGGGARCSANRPPVRAHLLTAELGGWGCALTACLPASPPPSLRAAAAAGAGVLRRAGAGRAGGHLLLLCEDGGHRPRGAPLPAGHSPRQGPQARHAVRELRGCRAPGPACHCPRWRQQQQRRAASRVAAAKPPPSPLSPAAVASRTSPSSTL